MHQMGKSNVVYTYSGMLISLQMEWILTAARTQIPEALKVLEFQMLTTQTFA